MITISMPLFVMIPRKTKKDKKVILNLNVYRNLNFRVECEAKKLYSEIAVSMLGDIRFNEPIQLKFEYFKGTARKSDRANVLSIHEKYFCDALQKAGCIVDDSDEYIMSTLYIGGDIDRDNPRVEITIEAA